MGQITDLRPNWADDIATEVSNWNLRDPLPIRLLSEIGISGDYWLQALYSVQKYPPVDFRGNQPPWLSNAGSVEDPTMQIEHLAFFGYVWEPYHSLRVNGASRDYKTGIDISLWEFGVDTTEMEICKIYY